MDKEAHASDPPPVNLNGRALFPSGPARLLAQAATRPEAPAYFVHENGDWRPTSWGDYAAAVRQTAKAFMALGLEAGGAVGIRGFNRPEWTAAAHAAMMAGGKPAGIYFTTAPPEIAYILEHSEAPIAVVETVEDAKTVAPMREIIATLKHIVVMTGESDPGGAWMSWADCLAKGASVHDADLDARLEAIAESNIGSLIYTSGTTGPPKAVMLSHGALAWTAYALTEAFSAHGDDRVLSYLPLAHIAEQQTSVHNHVVGGGAIYFARSLETLAEDLQTVRPTIFFGVPRVWEKMAETIQGRLAQATGTRAKLAKWAMGKARAWREADLEGRKPGAMLSMNKGLAGRLVQSKIKAALGLDDARILISGAAPISPDVLRFFLGLDLVIREGYGQSETGAPTTINLPGATRLGSVGRPFPGIAVRAAEDGELEVKTPGVFAGYMKDNAATEASFTADGWLITGDLGHVDADGFVYITGRKKEILITSGGKNISPANLETDLMNHALIEHAVVVGDAQPYLTCLLTLAEEPLAAFIKQEGIEGEPREHPKVLGEIQSAIDEVNTHHARVENIRKFRILPRALSLEADELTPTLKVKRRKVLENHAALIEEMYAEGKDGDYR